MGRTGGGRTTRSGGGGGGGRSAGCPRAGARDRALGLLAVRWRSREELRRRLVRAGFDPREVELTLEDLERAGLVEDARFAAEVARDRAERRLDGARAIREALRQKGVPPELIEASVAATGDEGERAGRLAARTLPRLAGLSPERAGRRLYALLVRRGYSPEVAREAAAAALRGLGHGERDDLPGGGD